MGSVKKNKAIPFSLFFLKYFAYLCIAVLLITVTAFMTFHLLVLNHLVYRADYAQQQASEAADKIANAQEVSRDMIPELCEFAIFNADGTMTSGNIAKSSIKNAWNAVQGDTIDNARNYYKVIKRGREYCVLKYQIIPQYKSAQLRNALPNPQILIMAVAILILLLFIIFVALRFGRALKNRLRPLILATEKIQNQELEFTILPSKIKEIDTVLNSLDQMRAALKDSLQKQWLLEQSRKEQMAALAHDLKTPLTIIRGNTDLLNETSLTAEQRECAEYIQNSTLQMQNYVKALIEISYAENDRTVELQNIDLQSFIKNLHTKMEGLLIAKKIELNMSIKEIPNTLTMNEFLFSRALLNIFSNAVDFTPAKGVITFDVTANKTAVEFKISDSGAGFSPEALANATSQFYMEDESRSSNLHYGMGLYIANTIIVKHNGKISLSNSKQLKGAEVTVSIPY